VGDEAEFRVRTSVSDEDAFRTTSAILRAAGPDGKYIKIFVDREHPWEKPGNLTR